jgi:hyperosmotically inducible protein
LSSRRPSPIFTKQEILGRLEIAVSSTGVEVRGMLRFAVILPMSIVLALAAQPSPAGQSQIQRAIEANLLEENLSGVEVDVDGDTVILSGKVPSLFGRTKAEEIAEEHDGVERVENRIVVNRQPDDQRIAGRVNRRLANYVHYSIYDLVTVAVRNGVVILGGKVTMPYKAEEMARMASRVQGVQEVKNQIETLPVSIGDEDLRHRIASRIYGDSMFFEYSIQSQPPIHILVENGRVTLAGEVSSEGEKLRAEQIARSTFGVLEVDNQLQVG